MTISAFRVEATCMSQKLHDGLMLPVQYVLYHTVIHMIAHKLLYTIHPHRTHTHSLSLSVDNSEQAALHRT